MSSTSTGACTTLSSEPGGKLAVPIAEYEENLEKLIQRLRKTGAVVIGRSDHASSHHIKAGSARENKDVIRYNEAAVAIMRKEGISVDDLYGFIFPHLAELQQPEDVHFSDAGSDLIGDGGRNDHTKSPEQVAPRECGI